MDDKIIYKKQSKKRSQKHKQQPKKLRPNLKH